jgi:dGTPase
MTVDAELSGPLTPSPPVGATSARQAGWAATMAGHVAPDRRTRLAHDRACGLDATAGPLTREAREALEVATLAPGATRADGAGRRLRPEAADPWRTCFERDRDRILHCTAFRRLAGKTQVFVFPDDHQRTRLTHALEVAQVGRAIAGALRLNTALVEAIALGHDCGHGPGGHASEDAFAPYLEGGFDHATWGADVVLVPLNLTAEVLDGVRNHSWSRPAPATPEGDVVSWADRIAYVCHDFEDAVAAGIVRPGELPAPVREVCGETRGAQLGAFIAGVVEGTRRSGVVSMTEELGAALEAFRSFDYERIYLRPESRRQAAGVVRVLTALVDRLIAEPWRVPAPVPVPGAVPSAAAPAPGAAEAPSCTTGTAVEVPEAGSAEAARRAVAWVAGMTDRYALARAGELEGWPAGALSATVLGA